MGWRKIGTDALIVAAAWLCGMVGGRWGAERAAFKVARHAIQREFNKTAAEADQIIDNQLEWETR